MRRALSHTHRLIHKKLLLGSPYLRLHAAAPSTILCRQETTTTPRRSLTSSRPDPFARRPNKVCDPYGQGGKPLSVEDAEKLLTTVSEEWWLGEESSVHSISRDFEHADFIHGSTFLTHIAAVAQMNDHFPSLTLTRRLDSRKKAWRVISSVTCTTKVLEGLSHHDFFLATLIDVEIERPNVKSLIISTEKGKKES